MFTVVITATAKREIQEFLEHRGLSSGVMYPDLTGFVNYLRAQYTADSSD